MTAGRSLDYETFMQDALRGLVRNVLSHVIKTGLPGEHHFYISFDTTAPGVGMSRRLKEKYPEEMMIVLQHRFWDLAVNDDGFEVKLTFDGIPELLVIPWPALKVFFDPSVKFTLQLAETSREESSDGPPRRRRSDGADGGQSGSADRRPRPRPKPREEAAKQPESQSQQAAPAVLAPVPAPAPAPAVAKPAESAPAAAEPAVPIPAPVDPDAKVVSLDQFRKK